MPPSRCLAKPVKSPQLLCLLRCPPFLSVLACFALELLIHSSHRISIWPCSCAASQSPLLAMLPRVSLLVWINVAKVQMTAFFFTCLFVKHTFLSAIF